MLSENSNNDKFVFCVMLESLDYIGCKQICMYQKGERVKELETQWGDGCVVVKKGVEVDETKIWKKKKKKKMLRINCRDARVQI